MRLIKRLALVLLLMSFPMATIAAQGPSPQNAVETLDALDIYPAWSECVMRFDVIVSGTMSVRGPLSVGGGPFGIAEYLHAGIPIIDTAANLKNVTIDGQTVDGNGIKVNGLHADTVDGYELGAYIELADLEPVVPTGYIELISGGQRFRMLVIRE